MATATYISAPSTTPSVSLPPTTKVDGSSPLLKLIPYAYGAFSLLISLLSFSLAILKLVLSPLPILLYLVAPITTFLDVTTTLFIRLPYGAFLYFADALYPVYVLLGVACITGCIFGYGGRLVVGVLVNYLIKAEARVNGMSRKVPERRKSRGRQEVKFEFEE